VTALAAMHGRRTLKRIEDSASFLL